MTETTRLLRDLVALPSVNPMGRPLGGPDFLERRVTDYLEAFMRALGVPSERQSVAPGRDNFIAQTSLPGAQRTLLFEVHQDTVPTDGMIVDPFAARIEGDRLYGRGACDVKGGMAAMLAAIRRLVREQPRGAASVILVASIDEEHDNTGIRAVAQAGLRADLAIVAEPTCLQIVQAHKGIARWHLRTAGRSCHSSSPQLGINAIYRMAGVLVAIQQFAEYLRTMRTHPQLGPATLSVGRIEGGSSVNTVPDWCRIEIDRRLLPGEEPQRAVDELNEYLHSAGLDFAWESSALDFSMPPLSAEGAGEAIARLGRAIDEVLGSHEVTVAAYGTDAGPLAAAGIPTVVFGPGDIAQAHTNDEWVSLTQVEQAADILYRLACLE